jgi:methyl-accepting chemotaxis protein
MLRFLSNIPISRRLFTLFFIAAAIPAIVIILLGNFYISQLTTRSQAVQTSFDAQSLASQELVNLQRMNALVQTRFNQIFASLSGKITDPSLSNAGGLVSSDIAAREADFGQGLATYQANYDLTTSSNMDTIHSILINDNPATGPGIISSQQQALNAVATPKTGLWPRYQKLQEQEVALLDALDPSILGHPTVLPVDRLKSEYNKAYSLLWQANFQFTDLNNNWQRVVDDTSAMGKTVTSVGPSVTQPVLIATAIAVIATFLIVFVTGWLVSLTIASPLRRLAMLTRRIGSGDTTARAKVFGRDEIALVANSMNSMLDNIVRLIQDAQASRDNLQRQVEKLVSEVSGVGEGDLRIQAEVTADALGVLADSFNYMVEELSSLVVRVKMVAHEVENSTTMTFERMTQLVESADNQINQIAEAAIEVEGMADSSRNVAERAQVLYSVAREARRTAEGGREAVQQTVEGMGRINEYVLDTSSKVQTLGERSREINNIVEVISNIAHQTNRLALDAAIQAAMAGENGKGFGAVAGDIRRLAERAKDQASMIARIVRSVREDIGAAAVSMRDTERETSVGANLAQETGTSLESIFNVVERQAREIEIINQMATQQLQSSSAVVQIMHAVSDSTQQSSVSTRETAQNMERLARLAEQLLGSVEAFKLPDQTFDAAGRVFVSPVVQDMQRSISGSFRKITASAHHPAGAGAYPALAPAGAYGRSYPPAPSYPAARQGNAWPPVAPPPQWQQSPPQPRGNGMPPQQQPPPVSSPLRRPQRQQDMDPRRNGQ